MARETKIGITLMVLLVGVFGFVVYRKWDGLKPAADVAAAEGDAAKKGQTSADTPGAAKSPVTEPPSNPFASVAGDTAPPSDQAEPSDPFAGGQVPVRPVSRTAVEGWGDAASEADAAAGAQGEPFARGDAGAGESVPIEQGEPSGEATEASSETTVAATTAGENAGTEDPFVGDAAADAGSAPAPADDPFGEVASSSASDEGTSLFPGDAATNEAPAAAGSADPFGEVEASGATTAAPAGTEGQDAADPFSDAPSAVADAGGSEFVQPQPAEGTADPFGGADAVAATETVESTTSDTFAEGAEEASAVEAAAKGATDAALAGIEPEPEGVFTTADEPRTESAATAAGVDHVVVEESDSYWSISKRVYGTSVYFRALAKYNEKRIRDPKRLRAGMTVLTPDAEVLASLDPSLGPGATGSGSPAAEAGRPGFLVDAEGRPAYRVGDDDTLGKIAQSHLGRASRWVQIYEMNRGAIPDAKSLKPGTILRLPGDASRVRLVPEG